MSIILIAFAPVLIILFYIYRRDKYEKEPIGMLILSLVAGAIITLPIVFIELFLDAVYQPVDKIVNALYDGFVMAATTEELFKYLAFIIFIWRNKNFNELFDGIIYAAYISLGFAAVENFFYVFGGGGGVGILRAFTAVPAHALFGITMGYYLGLAKFNKNKKTGYLWLAILVPIIIHGLYDFFLMSENGILLLVFIPFIIYLWIAGFRKMKKHSRNSVFKDSQQKT